MVITMELKHVILRGKRYFFRMRVPDDCIRQLGKKEIVQSLHTGDPLEAKTSAAQLEEQWKQKFNTVRKHKATTTRPFNIRNRDSLDKRLRLQELY